MKKNPNNCRAVEAYLKKRCPKYNKGLIYVGKRGSGRQYTIIVFVDNRLFRIETYGTTDELDCLVPKLNEYFDGKPFDTCNYFEYYEAKDAGVYAGKVYQFRFDPADLEEDADGGFGNGYPDQWKHLDKVRKDYPDVGIREVPKPDKFEIPDLS